MVAKWGVKRVKRVHLLIYHGTNVIIYLRSVDRTNVTVFSFPNKIEERNTWIRRLPNDKFICPQNNVNVGGISKVLILRILLTSHVTFHPKQRLYRDI